MADIGTQAAPQPASAPAPAAGQPAQAPAAPSFDPSEVQRLQRIEQQWKGSQALIEKARSYGFEKPESFDQLGPAIKSMRDSGYDPNDIVRAFSKRQDADPDASPADIFKQMEARMDEKFSAREKAFIVTQAEKESTTTIDSEIDFVHKLNTGDDFKDLPTEYKETLRLAAIGRWMESRKPYGEDHPLKGRMGPAGKDGLDGIGKFLKDSTTATLTALQAKQAAAIGDAARKRPTVAGQGAGQGKPETTNAPTKRPDGKPSRERVEAEFDRLKKLREVRA